jgi:hypothetical protein
MYKQYYDISLQLHPSVFVESFCTQKENKIIKEIKVAKKELSPTRLIMDYMQKRIDRLDKAMIELKSQYPDLLSKFL